MCKEIAQRKWVDDKEIKINTEFLFDVKYQANFAILYSFVTSDHSVTVLTRASRTHTHTHKILFSIPVLFTVKYIVKSEKSQEVSSILHTFTLFYA